MGVIPIKLNKSVTFIIVALILCPIICSQVQFTEAASQKRGWKLSYNQFNWGWSWSLSTLQLSLQKASKQYQTISQ